MFSFPHAFPVNLLAENRNISYELQILLSVFLLGCYSHVRITESLLITLGMSFYYLSCGRNKKQCSCET